MKYTLALLVILTIIICSCNFKQKQFVTTLAIEDTVVTSGQIDTAIFVLKKRLESGQFKEVSVVANYKDKQILVQSGNLDKEWVNNYLLKKGALVFYECYTIEELTNSLQQADKMVAGIIGKGQKDAEINPLFNIINIAQPDGRNYNNQLPAYIGGVVKEKIAEFKKYIALAKDVFPVDATLFFHELPPNKSKVTYYEVYFLKDNSSKFFASNHVKSASATITNDYPAIKMSFDAYGANVFARITTKNVNKALVIVNDGNVISAPNIIAPIQGGDIEISGSFTKEETQDFALLLKSGYLPINLGFKNTKEVQTRK